MFGTKFCFYGYLFTLACRLCVEHTKRHHTSERLSATMQAATMQAATM
ncbi:hypothetical protein HMPREF3190_01432 [Umbribacter vaginalis]|nr:hypothetical protein HMPREF3190_01432 [Coriobacteriales bacterium DNF00809]